MEKSHENVKAFGWAARDTSGVLSPFNFSRRYHLFRFTLYKLTAQIVYILYELDIHNISTLIVYILCILISNILIN